ncbi:MAG: hypothetical protein K0Q76_2646 [Panacagrimonas sp.]|jgi:hypothetical protein|nr:hypothetical protein [Panacagrimonas sp.]MCC2657538.1 hypothetical protein [Panacagrimonas sp.]
MATSSRKTAADDGKTCAVCDYKLDDSAIKVRFGRHIVEVCCEECAQKLREARASANVGAKA